MTRTATLAATLAMLLAAASLALIGTAGAATEPVPTQQHIDAAVKTASHSPNLWATINICNPKSHKHVIGIRGQMPSLGFPSRLVMVFQLFYWSAGKHRYLPVANSRHPYVVGNSATAVIQYGVSYSFPPTVTLTGQITFKWFRGATVLGSVTVKTTAGHKDVNDASPAHFSVGTCTIAK